jgi:hypothetical protein
MSGGPLASFPMIFRLLSMSALYFYFSNKYRYFFSNSDYNHQEMIIGAMHTLIYAVATPIPDSED